MTTGQTTEAQPVSEAPACKFDGRRRKFRGACCCVTLLLFINALLLMHTARSVRGIFGFVMDGSYTYDDTTYLFVPGGAKTLCNDLCVDMCIYNQVNCELNSCLNLCNQQLIDDGNADDFIPLPDSQQPMLMGEMNVLEPMDYVDYESDAPLTLVDTPPVNEIETEPQTSSDNGQEMLQKMKENIETAAEKVRQLKAAYMQRCDANPELFGCNLTKKTISKSIEMLNGLINGYDTFAASVEIDIKVSVWMNDVKEVTTQP